MATEQEEEAMQLISQFQTVVDKLKLFAMKVARESGFTEEHTILLQTGLQRSVLAYIMVFNTWFMKHKEAIAKRDIDYFRAQLPDAFQHYTFSDENRAKGVQFIEAIEDLLRDYNGE